MLAAMVMVPAAGTVLHADTPVAGRLKGVTSTGLHGAATPVTVALAASGFSPIYPSGSPDPTTPSGEAPPGPTDFPGYLQSYVTDFSGTSLPPGWSVFTGTPSGDPGAQWGANHVTVGDGLLQLNTFQDSAYGNKWVNGGLCQCGLARTYGAYFVRSRMTGPGATQVELLWPAVGWPPEIDFNETYGGTNYSMATDHFNSTNDQLHSKVSVNMTLWHTWGVIWTPTTITYTLDGSVWGMAYGAGTVPSQPMTLDIQQQSWCASNWACPTTPQSTLVDWVAEYTPSVHSTSSVGPFKTSSSDLSSTLRAQIAVVAKRIKDSGNPTVSIVGYGDTLANNPKSRTVSRSRAVAVALFLKKRLSLLSLAGTRVSITAPSASDQTASNTVSSAVNNLGRVVISLN